MGYLNKEGLTYLWEKLRIALASKQNKLAPGDGIQITNNTISTESRIVSLTADEYNALPQEEKDRDDILYVVDEPSWIPVSLSIQEYDMDGWHIRKQSNGYVEMSFSGEAVADITVAAGSLYQCVGFGSQEYPVPLVHKYAELRDVSASVAVIPTYSYGAEAKPLKSTCSINLYRPTVAPNLQVAYSFFVAGRWK